MGQYFSHIAVGDTMNIKEALATHPDAREETHNSLEEARLSVLLRAMERGDKWYDVYHSDEDHGSYVSPDDFVVPTMLRKQK